MPRITKIEQTKSSAKKYMKKKVAAYCRVSTDSTEQLLSLEAQRMHYEKYIKSHEEWEYAGIYSDEGVSGTKKEKRLALLQLLSDCERGNVDFIITKSISRFSRNTVDCLELVRSLLNLNVGIYFEKEKINTAEMGNELILSILSTLAESESVSISQNNKWAIKKRFADGTYIVSTPTYGYENVDGKMVINDEEAKNVKFMFAQILAGVSTHQIAKSLNRQGVLTRKGYKWYSNTVGAILTNEKYTGDILFQKTYTDDHFNRHLNDGNEGQYYVKNHHEPIISHEELKKAREMMDQHCREKKIEAGNSKYTNRYPFTKKIVCSECGGNFKRRSCSSGKRYIAWGCTTHLKEKEICSMQAIRNDELEGAFITMMNKLIFARNQVLKPLLGRLREGYSEAYIEELDELETKIEDCGKRSQQIQMLMSKGYLQPAAYNMEKNTLRLEVKDYKHQRKQLIYRMNHAYTAEVEVAKLYKFTQKSEMLQAFDGKIFEIFVEKIVVQSKTRLEFHLQCGLVLEERL